MKLIDNHCHLDYQQFDADREDVIAECREKMEAVICAGADREANRRAVSLAAEHEGFIHACAGLHPTRVPELTGDDVDAVEEQVRELAGKTIAVGEIGMDYHHVTDPEGRKRQKDVFERFLEVAADRDMPVVVHSRDAESQVLDVLPSYDLDQVIMHCFNGSESELADAVDAGHWISISTQVLYSNRVQMIAEKTPLDRILLETDAPFLYPGETRNVPWHVHESLERIASIRGETGQDLAEQFNENTRVAYANKL